MTDNTIDINSSTPITKKRARYKFTLIRAPKCKQFALEFAASNRAHKFTRVHEDFLIECEEALRRYIIGKIKSHPSTGKTLS